MACDGSSLSAVDEIGRVDGQASHEMVEWEGRLVAWRRFGAGRPLVLVHGGHGNWTHWIRNIEALALQREVWVPDLPGYGDSDDAAPEGGLSAIVSPLAATLDLLIGQHASVDVVGFSFGGLVAAHLATQRPGIERLALLAPAGHGSRRRPRGALQNWKAAAASGDLAALEAVMRHNLAMHMLSAEAAAIDLLAVAVHTRACMKTRFRSKEISRAGGLFDTLAGYRRPVLMLWGEHDVTANPATLAGNHLARDPRCRIEVVGNAGHWVQYERADEVNSRLRTWHDEQQET
jgi:pimeloyl-ACP methyl ester carboxylesterase